MLAALLLAFGIQGPLRPQAANVLVVVLDDVGLEWFACYGDQNHYDVQPFAYAFTPNIDALAAGGARFTQCRATPLCSPSRACFLTGRYPFRTGTGALVKTSEKSAWFVELGNPRPEIGLPSLLPGRRAAFGKWHLGLDSAFGGTMPVHPLHMGFGSWRGTSGNIGGSYYDFGWWEGGVLGQIAGVYSTDFIRQNAVRWLGLHRNEPFFLYVAFNACHEPQSKAKDYAPLSEHGFGTTPDALKKTTIVRAALEAFDFNLGLLLGALPRDTYVFLVGDNGTQPAFNQTHGDVRYPKGHPLHRTGDHVTLLDTSPYDSLPSKGSVFETGIRVPLIVAGPGVVPGVRSDLVDAVDLFATIAVLRGADVPESAAQDSQGFYEVLAGGKGSRTFSFTQNFSPNGAPVGARTIDDYAYVRRDGPHLWKLVSTLGAQDLFFDVAEDPLEWIDLGTGHPEYRPTREALDALIQ